MVRNKSVKADLSNAQIAELIIAGQKITDFYEDPDRLSATNIGLFLPFHRVYKLKAPIIFTPQDTASIKVNNVKISESGKILPWFGLDEPNGIFCLSTKHTIISLGSKVSALKPTFIQQKKTVEPTKISATHAPSSTIAPTRPEQKTVRKNAEKIEKKSNSPIQSLLQWINTIFSKR